MSTCVGLFFLSNSRINQMTKIGKFEQSLLHSLQSSNDGNHDQAQTKTVASGASDRDLAGSGGSRRADGADRGPGGNLGGGGSRRDRKVIGGSGNLLSGERDLSGGSGDVLSGSRSRLSRNLDLRNSDLGRDDLGGAALRDCGAISDARLGDSGLDDDSGVGNGGDNWGASDGEVVSDGVDVGDNTGVLVDVRSADALEERDGLGDDVISLTIGIQALVGLLNELLVGAEASDIEVVLALLDNVEPGVQALGDNFGARKGLLRLILIGVLRVLRLLRALGGSRRNGERLLRNVRLFRRVGSSGLRVGDGLSDRADGGADGDGLSNNSASAGGAVRDLRTTRGDGGDLCSEDSRSAVVCGGDGSLRDIGNIRLFGRLRGSGLRVGDGLGDRADGGANSNSLSDDSASASRAVRDLGAARGDGGDLRGVDSRSAIICGGDGSLRDVGNVGNVRHRGGGDAGGIGAARSGGRETGSGGRQTRCLDRRGGRQNGGDGRLARNHRDRLDGCRLNGKGLNRSGLSRGSGRGVLRRRVLSGRGRSVVVTVEVDLGDLDLALLLLQVGLIREDDLDVLSTTALGVANLGTLAGAVRRVLAGRAIRHIVVELETAVELGEDIELANGELVDLGLGAAAKRRGLSLVATTLAADDLAPVRIVFTGPALEVETGVEVKGARDQILPVEEATRELVLTLVIRVAGASEGAGTVELVAEVEATLAKLDSG